MRAIDARSAELGVPTRTLMENAGRAVAHAVLSRFSERPSLVLCGPGGNGGDGFVAARLLREAGWPVRVGLLGPRDGLRGDAADAARTCPVTIETLDADWPVHESLVIDALFGAGLSRPLDGVAAALCARARSVVAVDVPSGLHGDGEAPTGPVFDAALTVTFVRKKLAHVLEPGRSMCGEIVVADIGAPEAAVAECGARVLENGPDVWPLPWPGVSSHKHARGKVAVWAKAAGMSLTSGAPRLTARAAQRAGAGWVTALIAPEDAHLWAGEPASLIVRSAEIDAVAAHDAVVFGPGAGRGVETAELAIALAQVQPRIVLDADALSSAANSPDALFEALTPSAVLTPHAGEFVRLFADCGAGSKVTRARAAAARANAVVLFKGADTVIAAPDGRAMVNTHATPWLASAGSGDVLAGMIAALMAQGMASFEAAAAAAWLHGEAGLRCGPGLLADDLASILPAVLDDLAPAALKRRR